MPNDENRAPGRPHAADGVTGVAFGLPEFGFPVFGFHANVELRLESSKGGVTACLLHNEPASCFSAARLRASGP